MEKITKINWHKENLTLATKVTDTYKTTQNVRRFFCTQLGENFKFTREIMQNIKSSLDKSLGEIINELKS